MTLILLQVKYIVFLFDEQKQALSAPESWTGTDDVTGKDFIWFPITNDKSDKEITE